MDGSSSAGPNGPSPDQFRRLGAAFLDGVVATGFSVLFGGAPLLGSLLGGAYLVVRDGFELGPLRFRSVGKYVTGLGLVHLDQRPLRLETSIQRNWMLGVTPAAGALIAVPIVGGALVSLISLVGTGLVLFEVYNVLADPAGRRWGDRLAHTKVVDTDGGFV